MKASALLLLSTLAVGALGVSSSPSSAAPASGVDIGTAASAGQLTEHVWYRRWGWGPGWGYRRAWWGQGWGYRAWGAGPGWGGPGWCYYHPYRCGRW
jgi:hypothetical protein